MKTLKPLLTFAAGLIVGASLFYPHSVNAQGPHTIHVNLANGSTVVSGEVIGFSCVPLAPNDLRMNSPTTACYVATQ